MRKDEQEELRRLEQALLEADAREASEDWNDAAQNSDAWLEETFREFEEDPLTCEVYNTDDADVDMESYSQAVSQVPERGGCAIGVFLVLIGVLGAVAFWFFKKWGVL